MTISGGRTEQLDIFCRVTGFTSDFLSFIVVEHIWFFHGAIQLCFKSQSVVSNNHFCTSVIGSSLECFDTIGVKGYLACK